MNHFISEEDEQDYEQEKRIQEWLAKSSAESDGFDFKYISSKGTARNSRIRASISLDQKIGEDSSGTFADLIAGSDGRDIPSGDEIDLNEHIDGYLACLGFDEETSEWIIKTLKLSQQLNSRRSQTFLTDSEW